MGRVASLGFEGEAGVEDVPPPSAHGTGGEGSRWQGEAGGRAFWSDIGASSSRFARLTGTSIVTIISSRPRSSHVKWRKPRRVPSLKVSLAKASMRLSLPIVRRPTREASR